MLPWREQRLCACLCVHVRVCVHERTVTPLFAFISIIKENTPIALMLETRTVACAPDRGCLLRRAELLRITIKPTLASRTRIQGDFSFLLN